MYDVFVRNWYTYGPRDQYTGRRRIVPGAGRKEYLARGVSLDEARRICEQYNATHNPGPLSRKAEFSS